jgi:hypothetical protein
MPSASKTTPSPCRLPAEMLDDIMSRLNRRWLARVAKASQVLNAVATPRLYESVTLSTLATLLARHDLRRFGKNLEILHDLSFEKSDAERDEALGADDDVASPIPSHTPFQEQIQSLGLAESLVQALGRGAKWAEALLLIHLLPSLQSLHLGGWWPIECSQFFQEAVPLFGEPTLLAPGLRSLRRLVCTCGGDDDTEDDGFDADTILRMLVLPSLNYLSVDLVIADGWGDYSEQQLASLYGTSSVTTLVFIVSAIDPRTLGHFVRIPHALASFEYSHIGLTLGYAKIGVGEFASALYPVREHLRELVIHDYSGELPGGAFGSLREFKSLVKSRTKVSPYLLTDEQ